MVKQTLALKKHRVLGLKFGLWFDIGWKTQNPMFFGCQRLGLSLVELEEA